MNPPEVKEDLAATGVAIIMVGAADLLAVAEAASGWNLLPMLLLDPILIVGCWTEADIVKGAALDDMLEATGVYTVPVFNLDPAIDMAGAILVPVLVLATLLTTLTLVAP